jgi:tRNA A-37 threonylcarbamoyl transferase component Bud32
MTERGREVCGGGDGRRDNRRRGAYNQPAVGDESLEQTLRDLARVGVLVKDRGYRQVWRFEHGGRAYYLKFYPRHGRRDAWRRLFRGSPAFHEFDRLQRLQRARVPAPRAVAYLVGLRLGDDVGDAVILEALEPGVPLDEYLNDLDVNGVAVPDHLGLSRQVRQLVHDLGRAGLGHEDLHLGNFLLHQGALYLLDGYAVRPGGLTQADVFRLWHNASRFATRTDLLRGWKLLGKDAPPPKHNPVSARVFRSFLGRVTGDNRYFGRLDFGDGWRGVFFKRAKYPRPWSAASRQTFDAEQWERQWPELLRQIEADAFEVIKRSRSGDVLAGRVSADEASIEVIVKRPRRRYWHRYLNEVGRGGRARRAWVKSWKLLARNVPAAWPLLLMEKRKLGYVVDQLIVFERVAGPTMAMADLDALPADRRDMLFRRVGRVLRRLEGFGFSHFDAKASNWIVRPDAGRGESPVLVDLDGIRHRRWAGAGVRRLLKSMENHPQFTAADALALRQGYEPFAKSQVPRAARQAPGRGVPPDPALATRQSALPTEAPE